MPSYLDFDTTKKFRDFILGKTLSTPNGPQSMNAGSYNVQNLSDFPNKTSGDVTVKRNDELQITQNSNLFKPYEFLVQENTRTIPRRANLNLYPYFNAGQSHSLIGILNGDNYDNESELFKFAAYNIKDNPNGPLQARIAQNLYASTVGRVRLIDALQGNSTTAINLLTGREPLVEYNNKITVAKTLPGKVIDFVQTVAGVEFPFSEIPGDYLSNPRNPVNYRPTASSELGKVYQDATGAIGSLLGIQRRPKLDRKPSDLLIEYMGEGSKQRLFDNLSFSKYAPNYTTTARSQNTSNFFKSVDSAAQGIKNLLGLEAPTKGVYIGDDRTNDVKFAMSSFDDIQVRSNYYLSLMFDPVQAELFQKKRNITEGGQISGKLTWISSKSKNKLGANNSEYSGERSQFEDSLSTKFTFREDSLLGYTQTLLNSMPSDGGAARSHISNVIDQTSRVFKEGDVMMSRGSAIKYTNHFTGEEGGIEYCRVWTKDRSYMNYTDTMRGTGLLRKYDSSVMTKPWNLNIAPMSNGKGSFDGSTNIVPGNGGFYAKKYMFSIENLAWKTSNVPNFTYNDLPYCERGNNGGRVMWFPPYDLKVTESNSAKWEENVFLGRPEPIYTYQNTTRSGNISFKVVVDHPSVLNLLVREHFKGMSDEEADNYINAFFAGCEELDFYALIRKYTNLDRTDIERIIAYLNSGKDPEPIKRWKSELEPVKSNNVPEPPNENGGNGAADGDPGSKEFVATLYFENDLPHKGKDELVGDAYDSMYNHYTQAQGAYLIRLKQGLNTLFTTNTWGPKSKNDYKILYNEDAATKPDNGKATELSGKTITEINKGFDELTSTFNKYKAKTDEIKAKLADKTMQTITLKVGSTCSSVADDNYNLKLSYRRSSSIIQDFIDRIKSDKANADKVKFSWPKGTVVNDKEKEKQEKTLPSITFKDLGYDIPGELKFGLVDNKGEQFQSSISSHKNIDCHNKNFKTSDDLKVTAPLTFYCREATLGVTYKSKPKEPDPTPPPIVVTPPPGVKLKLIEEKPKKSPPPLDELKRIIMKTLSECFYFKKLEDDSPVAFASLKEKLRYFHPAFHSTTPEGLNARLTFLHQCIRSGDTLPIKGISDVNDMNARNTTFGPPPVCVLRIGDFYHSKIIIRDVGITYDDNVWDLNPEGIGVQPMIATVSLQVSFIGGQGMEKPVERLQNALSSNFYANTEVYDFRATATEDRFKFNKEFLDEMIKDVTPVTVPKADPDKANVLSKGQFIGESTKTVLGQLLSYTKLIDDLYKNTENYFTAYLSTLKNLSTKYGKKLVGLYFLPNYKDAFTYDVEDGSSVVTIPLLGQNKSPNNLSVLLTDFRKKMINDADTFSHNFLLGIDTEFGQPILRTSEELLRKYVRDHIRSLTEEMGTSSELKDLETKRNTLISNLDKLNFITKVGHDGKVEDFKTGNVKKYTGAKFYPTTGFTATEFYTNYSDCVTYINTNHGKLTEGIDNSFVFNNSEIGQDLYKEFLGVILKDKKQEILNLYKKDSVTFTSRTVDIISTKLDKFLAKTTPLEPKLPAYPKRKNSNKIQFLISDLTVENNNYAFTSEEKEKLIKVLSSTVKLTTDKLNYYKP